MGEGILIAVEGIDGAGKTTLVAKLRDALVAAGEIVTASREPTDGQWGRMIRDSATQGRRPPAEELELFIKDRDEHVAEKIKPALERGEIVLLDRFFYSTIAYQGATGNGVEQLNANMRSRYPTPDVVLFVDTHPAVAMERIEKVRGDQPNHFERQEYLERVRSIFLRLAAVDREIKTIDGHPSAEDVFAAAGHVLLEGVLKAKRCFKNYECDIFYCLYRINHECRWAEIYPKIKAAARA